MEGAGVGGGAGEGYGVLTECKLFIAALLYCCIVLFGVSTHDSKCKVRNWKVDLNFDCHILWTFFRQDVVFIRLLHRLRNRILERIFTVYKANTTGIHISRTEIQYVDLPFVQTSTGKASNCLSQNMFDKLFNRGLTDLQRSDWQSARIRGWGEELQELTSCTFFFCLPVCAWGGQYVLLHWGVLGQRQFTTLNKKIKKGCFLNCEGQNHKPVSTDHNLWSERRAEAKWNRRPSAYQPNALPLGQTDSHRSRSPVMPYLARKT